MEKEYSPLFERTSKKQPKGPWGGPSDLVHYAKSNGMLDELNVSFLDFDLIVEANNAHLKTLDSYDQKEDKSWNESDTKEAAQLMINLFKEAGKNKMYDTRPKKDKNAPQTITQQDVMQNSKMPEDLKNSLMLSKPKVEKTKKDKQKNRKGKYQQKLKQQLKDYTKM
jgi:hypothetical protein